MKKYAELPMIEDTGYRRCWNEWGPGDELGSLDRVTPETVLAAAREARKGKVFSLDLRLVATERDAVGAFRGFTTARACPLEIEGGGG